VSRVNVMNSNHEFVKPVFKFINDFLGGANISRQGVNNSGQGVR
jgi:hypothetical protein